MVGAHGSVAGVDPGNGFPIFHMFFDAYTRNADQNMSIVPSSSQEIIR